MIHLDKKVVGIKGDTMKLSYPSEAMVASLPKVDGKPDTSFLPDDTYRNIILNCLALYATKDKREIMWVTALATEVINAGDEYEISDKHKKFLIDVLHEQTFQVREDGSRSGIYMSWATAQILSDLGVSSD